MSLRDFEFFHGAALLRLLECATDGLQVTRLGVVGAGCYEINRGLGIMIKYCKKRMRPWAFTFQREHRESLIQLERTHDKTVLLLVCNDDGIAVLDYGQALSLLQPATLRRWSISADRRPRGMYSISGTGGTIKGKIADGEGLDDLIQSLN